MKRVLYFWLGLIGILGLVSCEKYLEAKPNKTLAVPDNLSSLQALMDDYPRINNQAPATGESCTDDYYLTDADYAALDIEDYKRAYIWAGSNLFTRDPNEWLFAFTGVYYANTVFEQIAKIERNTLNASDWDNIKGQAHFTKGFFELQAAWLWCPSYMASTANTQLGIPLRQNTNFNEQSVRATVEETYADILSNLKRAIPLLPVRQIHVMRPSKACAYGMLSRTLLSMRRYDEAGLYADSALTLQPALINFNTLVATATYPIAKFNEEVLLDGILSLPSNLNNSRAKVNLDLYALYQDNDLRKTVYFKNNNNGSYAFKGSYAGSASLFSGLSTNELYLIKAECLARAGKTVQAMQTLDILLKNRYKTGTYTGYTVNTANEALQVILRERRKELLFRGLRWADIKRLNLEGANISMSRTVSGKTYTIEPNDKRFALPIPEAIIALSGMAQN